MSNDVTPPIEVTDNTLEGIVSTVARYLVATVGSYALGRGWIDSELLQLITGLVTVLVTAYGGYKTYTSKKRLIIAAEAAPDNKAVVVSA